MPNNEMEKTKQEKIDCFVIMPITVPSELLDAKIYDDSDHFKRVYSHIIEPAIKRNGWNPIYPKTEGSEVIIAEIVNNLLDAPMVVCDISILNPNVFYEAGIRTALNKPIAYIKDENIIKIPFDTSGIKHETYYSSLKVYNAENDILKISEHIKATHNKSKNENLAWNKYGMRITAQVKTSELNPTDAKFETILDEIRRLKQTRTPISSSYEYTTTSEPIETNQGKYYCHHIPVKNQAFIYDYNVYRKNVSLIQNIFSAEDFSKIIIESNAPDNIIIKLPDENFVKKYFEDIKKLENLYNINIKLKVLNI
jgi:hypothetical protein